MMLKATSRNSLTPKAPVSSWGTYRSTRPRRLCGTSSRTTSSFQRFQKRRRPAKTRSTARLMEQKQSQSKRSHVEAERNRVCAKSGWAHSRIQDDVKGSSASHKAEFASNVSQLCVSGLPYANSRDGGAEEPEEPLLRRSENHAPGGYYPCILQLQTYISYSTLLKARPDVLEAEMTQRNPSNPDTSCHGWKSAPR